jgi:hypothetical protein
MADSTPGTPYPVTLSIDYPDRELNRLTSFFRPFVALPVVIIMVLISGGPSGKWDEGWRFIAGAGGVIFLPTLLMLLFRWKYPRWWFDWNVNLTRFSTRVCAFLGLLTDAYPSTDEEQGVRLEIPYPEVRTQLKTGLPLVKWFLAIPHYFVLAFLGLAACVAVVIAWFAILFTGRYPKGLFNYVVGVLRWSLRVSAYAFILVTDRYPPFTLE